MAKVPVMRLEILKNIRSMENKIEAKELLIYSIVLGTMAAELK